MSIQLLPTLPPPPNPASDSKAEFIAKAQSFTAAQKDFGDSLNIAIPAINVAVTDALSSAETAKAHSTIAVTKASEASASAATATAAETTAVTKAAAASVSADAAITAAAQARNAVAIVTAGSGFPVPDPAAVGQFLCVTEDSFELSGVKLAEIQTKARAYFISG